MAPLVFCEVTSAFASPSGLVNPNYVEQGAQASTPGRHGSMKTWKKDTFS